MAIFKRNIWTIFYILLAFGLFSMAAIVFNTAKSIQNDFTVEQENLNKVSATSIHSIFLQYELMLDVLGHQLTAQNNYQSLEKSRAILDNLLQLNKTLAAFGLARPDGQLYITSSNLKNIKNLPNLAEKKETKSTFLHTLESNVMVIGRTYFHNTLQSLIIPIRKSIRNEKGEVIAVMTAGINVNKAFKLLGKNEFKSLIFRDFDYYLQLTDHRTINDAQVYQQKTPASYIQNLFGLIETKYKKEIEDLQLQEKVLTLRHTKYAVNLEVLSSVQYLNRYELWVATQLPYAIVKKSIYKQSLVYIFLIFFILVILYYLFKYIHDFEHKKQNALEYQANHDYLTSLHNRLYLSKVFADDQLKEPFSLLFIDMDNFKNVNDSYGHTYGDKILKEISHRLLSFKKSKSHLVRYSGDEFMFITPVTQKEKVKELAQSIINRLAEPYFIDQYQFVLGCSMGVAQYPIDGKNFDEVKRYADIAMYESKKQKNIYTLFEDSIKHQYLKYSLIEQELRSALKNEEVYMMYQPQVTAQGKLYGVEALVRWENEKLGFVGPDEFIKVAEDTGLMSGLGAFIIKQSLEEIREVQALSNLEFQLSINISVKQFMEKNFYKNLMRILKHVNFNHLKLTLEVTENVFIEDIKFILELLNRIKKHEIQVSLDDFGTGYSSLNLLRQLPIDELKIDKTFVDDILEDENSKNMVESIISIGQRLEIKLLAEGVETLEQKELLESYGCELFQGYYYSKPLKKDALLSYIQHQP